MLEKLGTLTESQGLANDQAVLLAYLSEHRQEINLDDPAWELVQGCITDKLEGLQKHSHAVAMKLIADSQGSFIKSL